MITIEKIKLDCEYARKVTASGSAFEIEILILINHIDTLSKALSLSCNHSTELIEKCLNYDATKK